MTTTNLGQRAEVALVELKKLRDGAANLGLRAFLAVKIDEIERFNSDTIEIPEDVRGFLPKGTL